MKLADLLARMLEPAEREAVLGDLAESGETGARALQGVLGLVMRRQAALWIAASRDRRAWLAVGLIVPALHYYGRAALNWWLIENYKYLDATVLAENHLSLDRAVWEMFCGWGLISAWAWATGFVAGSIVRRAGWPHASLAVAAAVYLCRHRWEPGSLRTVILAAVVLAPLLTGLYSGRRKAAA